MKMILITFLFQLLTGSINDSDINHFSNHKPVPPKIGDIAPEINLPSTDRSINYSLNELKGKMVLINFWASLVAPCRFENPNLVAAYQNFKDKNFQNGNGFSIFSVSMDTDLDDWKNAIQKDKLVWQYHVSDLQGYDSKTAAEYGVKAIPYNYLIDGNGKIIAINLRGNELTKILNSQVK